MSVRTAAWGVQSPTTWTRVRNAIVFAEGRESPGNHGRLCVKGRYGWDYVQHAQRLTVPLIRREDHYPKGAISQDVRGEHDGQPQAGWSGGL